MSDNETPKVETLSDDDLDSVSGGNEFSSHLSLKAENTGSGTCDSRGTGSCTNSGSGTCLG